MRYRALSVAIKAIGTAADQAARAAFELGKVTATLPPDPRGARVRVNGKQYVRLPTGKVYRLQFRVPQDPGASGRGRPTYLTASAEEAEAVRVEIVRVEMARRLLGDQ